MTDSLDTCHWLHKHDELMFVNYFAFVLIYEYIPESCQKRMLMLLNIKLHHCHQMNTPIQRKSDLE